MHDHPAPARPSAATRIDRIRIRHLKLLEEIAMTGSLTAAADSLGVSQPSATKLLQELERSLRCTLVHRGARGGTLTALGRTVLERFQIATRSIATACEAIAGSDETPLVRIGLLPVAGVTLIPVLVETLGRLRQLPRLRLIEGAVDALTTQLLRGDIDCMVGRLDARQLATLSSRLEISQLHDDPYEIACAPGHPVARKRQVRLASLAAAEWIAPPSGTHTRSALDHAFMRLGVPSPTPLIESSSFHASFAMIERNPAFLTIAPRSAVRHYEAMGRIVRVELARPFPEDRQVFITRQDLGGFPALLGIREALLNVSEAAMKSCGGGASAV